jgi:hypothetical protein
MVNVMLEIRENQRHPRAKNGLAHRVTLCVSEATQLRFGKVYLWLVT